MSTSLEIEYKTHLTEQDYERVLDFYHKKRTLQKKQINYYFDTPTWDLKKRAIALRIRAFETIGEITLKIKQENAHLEITETLTLEEINEALAKKILPEKEKIKEFLATQNLSAPLTLWGILETRRIEWQIPQGLLALDESHYEGFIDYELELEVCDYEKGKNDFRQLLQTLHLPYIASQNKVARLLEKMKQSSNTIS